MNINEIGPKCACGCGLTTNRRRSLKGKPWAKFRHGHWARVQPTGKDHHSYKTGTTKNIRGYILTRLEKGVTHPRANKGYVKRATLVVEAKLRRLLVPGEIVHHINGVKDDDRPENLVVWNQTDHMLHHRPGPSLNGSANPRATVTEDDVRTIRKLAGSVPWRELARRFGLKQTAYFAIVRKDTWKHVQ